MVFIKALLTGLVGVSLCMANISGIVTDTGTTPISGAVVQLENGGQTATTGADGSFTLSVSASTGILPGNGKLLPNGLSVGIAGNLMTVTITERSIVEVTTFNLNGKSLSTVRNTLDAGSHSIMLPCPGAGIYLYKVKSGNGELLLKGNSVGGASSGNVVPTQVASSKALAKLEKATAAINDVIVSTKDGYLNYRCVQYTSDTTGLQIKMIASAGTVTDADGNVYQTVRIGNQVWMAENLRVTKYNDGTAITKITDSAAWYNIYNNNLITPAYCYYSNTTISDSIKKYGALYNWYVVYPANSRKIAPAGWHVPSDSEWTIMEKYLVLNGYNWDGTTDTALYNKIAKSLAAKTDWVTYSTGGTIGCDLTKNNRSGFSALPGGYRSPIGDFRGQSDYGDWWSSTDGTTWDNTYFAFSRALNYNFEYLTPYNYYKCCGFSVRLLRD